MGLVHFSFKPMLPKSKKILANNIWYPVLIKKFFGSSALATNKLAEAQLIIHKKIMNIALYEFSFSTNSFWLTNRNIPENPSRTPINDKKLIFFPSNILIKTNTMIGWRDVSRAAKLESIYCKDHTSAPFPKPRNKKPAKQQLKACFEFIFIEKPNSLQKIKIRAAETENLKKNAETKLLAKGCDWILANDVSNGKIFGENNNEITFISKDKLETWDKMSKDSVAMKLSNNISDYFSA